MYMIRFLPFSLVDIHNLFSLIEMTCNTINTKDMDILYLNSPN